MLQYIPKEGTTMPNNYIESVRYTIYEKSLEQFNFITATDKEKEEHKKNFPIYYSDHELLKDFDWVYEHAECLFENGYYYVRLHGVDAYYTLFIAITKKYDLESDYQKFINYPSKEKDSFMEKWYYFAMQVVNFFFKDDYVIYDLLKKDGFLEYFMRYKELYTPDMFKYLPKEVFVKVFDSTRLIEHFLNHLNELTPDIIPHIAREQILLDSKFIKTVVRTHHLFDSYRLLRSISKHFSIEPYIEEHKKFCDREVQEIKDGIFTFLKEEYDLAPDFITSEYYNRDDLKKQITNRIKDIYGIPSIPKKLFFECLSKYYLIGFFISRHYETDPYNLLIDIETLYAFAIRHSHDLKGRYIYEFLLHSEEYDLMTLLEFYEKAKSCPLKDMLYDDWMQEKERMINDINSSLLDLSTLPIKENETGLSYYEIDNFDDCILVTNTNVDIHSKKEIAKLVIDVKNGHRPLEWISYHDNLHQGIYRDEEDYGQTSIKFIMGPLDPKRVGIVNHQDAYSLGITEIENDGQSSFKRRLYTAKELLKNTKSYNEITYLVDGTPFLPVGLLVEEKITDIEVNVARELGIPIYFRRHRIGDIKSYYLAHKDDTPLYQHYVYEEDRRMLF